MNSETGQYTPEELQKARHEHRKTDAMRAAEEKKQRLSRRNRAKAARRARKAGR